MALFSRKPGSDPDKKASKEITIINRLGLHARPSAMFVKICSKYKADIWVEKDGEQVNGKSIMGLMMLAAGCGSKLNVTCTGSDAEKALEEIEGLIQRRFDED
jgi:phosphocarrier protein HPr